MSRSQKRAPIPASRGKRPPAARAPRPMQARAEETRARILQNARDAFAEHGFDGTNIRDIARSADTSHSMITYHFGSKEHLWRESVRDMFALLQRAVLDPLEAEGTLPIEERFKLMTRRYVRYCAAHPEHARITISETIRGGARLDWMVKEFVRRNHRDVLPMISELMDRGYVPRMPVASFLYALTGMAQLPFALAKESALALDYDMLSDRAIEEHAEAVLALVLRQGKPRRR